jgi:hypothetical protein
MNLIPAKSGFRSVQRCDERLRRQMHHAHFVFGALGQGMQFADGISVTDTSASPSQSPVFRHFEEVVFAVHRANSSAPVRGPHLLSVRCGEHSTLQSFVLIYYRW